MVGSLHRGEYGRSHLSSCRREIQQTSWCLYLLKAESIYLGNIVCVSLNSGFTGGALIC